MIFGICANFLSLCKYHGFGMGFSALICLSFQILERNDGSLKKVLLQTLEQVPILSSFGLLMMKL